MMDIQYMKIRNMIIKNSNLYTNLTHPCLASQKGHHWANFADPNPKPQTAAIIVHIELTTVSVKFTRHAWVKEALIFQIEAFQAQESKPTFEVDAFNITHINMTK